MKTYDELDADQKEEALEYWVNLTLTNIICGEVGPIEFTPEVFSKMEEAMLEANRMQTPWFTSEYLMDAAGDEIREYALRNAQAGNVRYNDSDLYVVDL